MTTTANAPAYPRRTILRAAGLLAGATTALAVFPLGAAAAGSAARSTLRLAALLPESSSQPQYAANFLAGLRLAFQQARWSVALQTPEVGRGVGLAAATVETLLDAGTVDLLIG